MTTTNIRFTNFGSTTLVGAITAGQTAISVTNGAVFPSLTGSNYFYAVITDSLTAPTKQEIVKVTARSGNNLTITRGQDGTTGQAFDSGNYIELRPTNLAFQDVFDDAVTVARSDITAITGTLPTSKGGTGQNFSASTGFVKLTAGTASASTVNLTTDVTGTLPIAYGGTGQTTANTAFNALAPSQASNANKYLKTDGTNTSWDDIDHSDITNNLVILVDDYGAVGDGSTDDTVAIQAALNAGAALGSNSVVRLGPKRYVATSLIIPEGVLLLGSDKLPAVDHEVVGLGQVNSRFDQLNYSLIRSGAAANFITLRTHSGIKGVAIIPSWLNVSWDNDATDPATANAGAAYSGWTGTAIYTEGTSGGERAWNVLVENCLIAGFNKAIYGYAADGSIFKGIWGDCVYGIHITQTTDLCFVSQCHFWPILSWAAPIIDADHYQRPGTAYLMQINGILAGADGTRVSDCFAFGYDVGFHCAGAFSINFNNCYYDNASTARTGKYGFKVDGASPDFSMTGCQIQSAARGIVVEHGDVPITINGCSIRSCDTGMYLNVSANASATIANNTFYEVTTGIDIRDTNGYYHIAGNQFTRTTVGTYAILFTAANARTTLSHNRLVGSWTNTTYNGVVSHNASPIANAQSTLYKTLTSTSGAHYNSYKAVDYAPSGASTATVYGDYSQINVNTNQTVTAVTGIFSGIYKPSGANAAIATAKGYDQLTQVDASSGTPITTAIGYNMQPAVVATGAAITTLYGFLAADQADAQVTTAYNFYGGNAVSGTARWNAYMQGTAPNYFNGAVGGNYQALTNSGAPHSLNQTHKYVTANVTGASFQINLPDPASLGSGISWELIIRRIDASANTLTVAPLGGDSLINSSGASGNITPAANATLRLMSNGVDTWYQI